MNKYEIPIPKNWLLNGPDWMQNKLSSDLFCDVSNDSHEHVLVEKLRSEPQIISLLKNLEDWPGPVITNHKAAGHPLHKLAFLADLGFDGNDPRIKQIIRKIFTHLDPKGPPLSMVNIPKAFGGNGENVLSWMLCDSPLILYSLVSFGLMEDPAVVKAVDFFCNLNRDNGWPCSAAIELGRFRGPGRKEDPCPYATLIMLRTLAKMPDYHQHPSVQKGIDALLSLWEFRREHSAYLFKMGTDFSKLKAPLVWFDILHVLDVLSQFPGAIQEPRYQQILQILAEKADKEGKFYAESVWTTWKDWEFGQKKQPSYWITFLAHRILARSKIE
jgi:hypothetical protein